MTKVSLIGVSGGSCSGKTTFVRRALEVLGPENCAIIYQDNYYIDQSHLFDKDGGRVNFDHPSSLDFNLMAKHLKQIKKGHSIEVPTYDFATHTRKKECITLQPKPIVFVDGILILSQPDVRAYFDDSYYIECDEDLRFQRRLKRDTLERGRTEAGVKEQFLKQVNPMHKQFVEPSKEFAHHILSQEDYLNHLDRILEQLHKDHPTVELVN